MEPVVISIGVRRILFAVLILAGVASARAWDYENHRIVNRLAAASLPADFPAFAKDTAAQERLAFLSGEPDRWRNTPDLPLKHANGPDHYIDVEELAIYGLKPELLPVFRYDFVAQLAVFRSQHPDRFRSGGRDEDHTRDLIGLLPWATVETYGKVKSGFSYLKAYEQDGGTEAEVENARANILYCMGVLGHLVGDASQPLHTTVHHHGWTGPNPNGYSTNRFIHSLIDGGVFATVRPNFEEMRKKIRPAQPLTVAGRPAKQEEYFQAVMLYILEQHKQVEPLYRLEKAGKLNASNPSPEGRQFLQDQLVRAGQMLGDLWVAAWQEAPPDTFLKGQLARRNSGK